MLDVLIVDDEAPARTRLRKQLAPLVEAGRIRVQAEAENGGEAVERIREDRPDLVFLDVQMPGLSGFDVLERLGPDAQPNVVFVTAYDEYAVRAFEANAVDYLLKPVVRERLQSSVERVEELTRDPNRRPRSVERLGQLLDWLDDQSFGTPPPAVEPEVEPLRQISIPYRDRILVVPVERLVAAEVSDGITRLVILDEGEGGASRLSSYIVSYTLDQLESRLDPRAFLRVHRSAIVAFEHIREMITWFSGRYKIRLTGGHEVIASRDRSRILKKRLAL